MLQVSVRTTYYGDNGNWTCTRNPHMKIAVSVTRDADYSHPANPHMRQQESAP